MVNKTTNQYVSEVTKKHSGKDYDYSKTAYRGVNAYITVICLRHGPFEIRAGSHLTGNGGKGTGCKFCAREKIGASFRKSFEIFLEDARSVHGSRYLYSKEHYHGYSKKTKINCRKHGDFFQSPSNHINGNYGKGQGCPLCGIEDQKLTIAEFIRKSKKLYANKYTYEKTIYRHSSEKLIITCIEHGDYTVIAANHLSGNGACPQCVSGRNQFNPIEFEGKMYRGLEDIGSKHGLNGKSLAAFMKRLQKHQKGSRRKEQAIREALNKVHKPRDREIICHGIRYPSIKAFYDSARPKAHYNSIKRWILDEGIPPEQAINMKPSVVDGFGVIYLIEGPKRYIGQTTMSLDRRWNAHVRKAFDNGSALLHVAIRKHGTKQFQIKAMTKAVPVDQLSALETKLIRKFKTISPHGYNMEERGKSSRPRGKPTEYQGRTYSTQSEAARKKALTEGISYHCAVARLSKGIEKSNVLLNWDKVREIRALHNTGRYSYSELAQQFGCGSENIGSIIRGVTWKEKT